MATRCPWCNESIVVISANKVVKDIVCCYNESHLDSGTLEVCAEMAVWTIANTPYCNDHFHKRLQNIENGEMLEVARL